jgi:hypothetical protein
VTTTDWAMFDRQLVSRRRAIVEGLVEFVRLNSVSQESASVRVNGEWLAAALGAVASTGNSLRPAATPSFLGNAACPGPSC